MNIELDSKVVDYAKKNKFPGIVLENTPVGCSCVGIHIHAQPKYISELSDYEKKEEFELVDTQEELKIFVEKTILNLEGIYIFGVNNPFNKKVYLHCEIKKM